MSRLQHLNKGTVYLVGAGPGDPDLITIKGSKVLELADVIVYDRLANPELLGLTREDSEHIYVGKSPNKPSVSQEQINQILVSKALSGKHVARLKGGDPFVFGRGGEECEAMRANGVPYEVIPGISSALAAPSFAGIPVTHRKLARSFTVVTGHTITGTNDFENWCHLVHADTLVILMGMRNLANIAETLIQLGKHPDTPAAVIQEATFDSQKVAVGTLADIAQKASHLSSPATIVIGELVSLSHDLSWFNNDLDTVTETQPQLLANYAG